MARTIYLAVFSNGIKPAHYAVYIPTGEEPPRGKAIHVTGNPATGFFLQFKRNYNLEEELRTYQLTPLAQVNTQFIRDDPVAAESLDTTARDRLESVATIVTPPGRSPNPFDPSAPNCQNWMRDYVGRLVAEGVVPSSASQVVQDAPRFLKQQQSA